MKTGIFTKKIMKLASPDGYFPFIDFQSKLQLAYSHKKSFSKRLKIEPNLGQEKNLFLP